MVERNYNNVGGRGFGPYAALNRRNNIGSAYDDDRSINSSAERLVAPEASVPDLSLATSSTNHMVDMRGPEPDDFMVSEKGRAIKSRPDSTHTDLSPDLDQHDPKGADSHSHAMSLRGVLNVLTLFILVAALLMLFAGYPVLYHYLSTSESMKGGFNIGGTNGTGQVASLKAIRQLVDADTPASAKSWSSAISGNTYYLQFSDEFNEEGRTFWPGDDQFWTGVDIWYAGTVDYEWYSPEAINTTGGALVITMTDKPTHNLNFQSGMLQSWNKLCMQGGYLEFAIIQPGSHSTSGYWPAAWLMGNLGRPGYLATTDGMWPYSYQGCDTGILPGQVNAQGGPDQAVNSQATYAARGKLSKLPGMRTPSCTCSGQDHPGPNVNVGRSSPELDILEAQIQYRNGQKNSFASQSMQTAPFDDQYYWVNATPATTIHGANTDINSYVGGPYQEAVSAVSLIPQRGFQDVNLPDAQKYVTYAVEYEPDWNNNGGGYVTWYVDGKPTWTVTGDTLPPSTVMEISRRNIPTEPMSVIINLGMSPGFQEVDFTAGGVAFPAQMKVDYVRVYQQKGAEKMSCDPPDHPTSDYINKHIDVYNNPNLTTWNKTKYAWPKNKLRTGC